MFPIIFQTNSFTLYTLWIFVAIAIFVTTYTTVKLAINNSLKLQFLSKNILNISFIALIGARLFAVIENFNIYFLDFNSTKFWNLFVIWDNNLSALGAIIAVIIYLKFLTKKQDQNYFQWLDVIVPASILGLSIGHIGNFLDGQAYGHESTLPWALHIESITILYDVPIHPTQIYAFLYSTGIFLLLQFIHTHSENLKEGKYPGFIGTLGITLYSLFTYIEEFFRGDDTLILNERSFLIQWLKSEQSTWQFTIRIPQIIALLVFIAAAIYLYKNYKPMLFSKQKSTK